MSENCSFCRYSGYKVIKLYKKLWSKELGIKFNSTCLDNKVVPKWVSCTNPNYSKQYIFRMIKNRNQDFQIQTQKLKREIDLIRTKIEACCTTNHIDQWIGGQGAKFKNLIETRHHTKLKNFGISLKTEISEARIFNYTIKIKHQSIVL